MRARFLVLAALIAAFPRAAIAQGEPTAPVTPDSAQSPAASPDAPAPPVGVVSSAGPRGFGFASPDGADSLFVHWLVDADYASYVGDKPPAVPGRDAFNLGFAGLQLDATLSRIFRSSVLVDFSQSRLTLLDAFVELRAAPELVLRVGKFPTPINEERLTPLILLPWIATGVASSLLPVRELGAQVYGELWEGIASYNLALVNGGWAGSLADGDADSFKDGMGRVFVRPFRSMGVAPIAKLGFGIGGSYGEHQGTLANPETPVLRTYGGAAFFAYTSDGTPTGTAVAGGVVSRIVPHVTYAWGPFAAFADYVHEVDHFGATAVASDAFGATASVAITGEDAEPFARIHVKRPWDPTRGHFGGVQLVAGGGVLGVSDDAFRARLATPLSVRREKVLGAGVNWYLIDGAGLLLDYSHTEFDAYAGGPARPAEDAIHGRVEFHM